jgi:hypothetical protein
MSFRLGEPGTATAGRRRQPVAGPRRLPRARPDDPSDAPVREPHWAEVPDWSAATLERLAALTPLEQAVVVWRVAGYSGAEAYRKATGRDSASARQSANQILRRPEVAAAVAAGLTDRNFAGRLDLEWLLQKLHWVIVSCQDAGSASHLNTLVNSIRLMARLQGELPGGRGGVRRRSLPPPRPEPAGRSPAMERIEAILAEADRRAAAARAAAPPPATSPPAADATVSEPAGHEEPVGAGPHLAADGLPIGVVRPFIPPTRPAPPPAVEPGPVPVAQAGPAIPRGGDGPVRYRGASPYFSGNWA